MHQVGDSLRRRGEDIRSSSSGPASLDGQSLGPLGSGTTGNINDVLSNVHSRTQSMGTRVIGAGDTLHANASAYERNESGIAHGFQTVYPSSSSAARIGYTRSEPSSYRFYPSSKPDGSPNPPLVPLPPVTAPSSSGPIPWAADPTAGHQGHFFVLSPTSPSGYRPGHSNLTPSGYSTPYDIQTPQSMSKPPRKPKRSSTAVPSGSSSSSRPSRRKSTHHASATVYDQYGNALTPTSYWQSGSMTEEEAALAYPMKSQATHTEHRIIRNPEINAAAQQPGCSVHIYGQYPPCPNCQAGMLNFGAQTGAHVVYRYPHEQTGLDQTWSSQNMTPEQFHRAYGYYPPKY